LLTREFQGPLAGALDTEELSLGLKGLDVTTVFPGVVGWGRAPGRKGRAEQRTQQGRDTEASRSFSFSSLCPHHNPSHHLPGANLHRELIAGLPNLG
jgi:hypothetical protein